MQVKKFEARTMKEALDMVKKQLGPEAIILGARDNRKSFGLVGEGSVEITAAISTEVLHKKQFAESRMRPQDREKFQNSTARSQKQVMEKFANKYAEDHKQPRAVTKTRYIEIDNQVQEEMFTQEAPTEAAEVRIKSAAQRAWEAMQQQEDQIARDEIKPSKKNVEMLEVKQSEILALKTELAGLKHALSHFQKVPQSILPSHPGSEFGLSYEFSSTFEKLTQAGMTSEIAAEILNVAQTQMPPVRFKNKALVDAWAARYILDTTRIVGEKTPSKVQIFVGPGGTGKTSALVKLAAHAAVKEQKRVVLLTADTFKVGAIDQMRIYANILNVPFAVIRKQSDWPYLLNQLAQFDYILCDFPGMSLKNVEEISTLRSLLPPEKAHADVHLVLPATAKNEELYQAGKRFRVCNFTDVIFTGLDEAIQHGSIYNFMKTFDVPLHSFGVGNRVPEDFEIATRERVLDLIFKLSNMKKNQE